MRTYFSKLPAGQVLKTRGRKYWATYAFIFLFILMYALQLGKFFSPSIQRVFFKQFHLHGTSFVRWAALQTVPSMYSFSNELWWSRHPLDEQHLFERSGADLDRYYVWLNHFPLHFVTYNHYRDLFFQDFKKSHLLIRTRFRGQELNSIYSLKRNGGVLDLTLEHYYGK